MGNIDTNPVFICATCGRDTTELDVCALDKLDLDWESAFEEFVDGKYED